MRDPFWNIKDALQSTKPGLVAEFDAIRQRSPGALTALLKQNYPGPDWGQMSIGFIPDAVRAYGETT